MVNTFQGQSRENIADMPPHPGPVLRGHRRNQSDTSALRMPQTQRHSAFRVYSQEASFLPIPGDLSKAKSASTTPAQSPPE